MTSLLAPSRRQVIIRERLRFPSGFSTAVLISVLHGKGRTSASSETLHLAAEGGFASLVTPVREDAEAEADPEPEQDARQQSADWAVNLRNLVICFAVSGAFTVCTYFFPILRNLPIFGSQAAHVWLWTLNPSLAYVGQGIIMGAETTSHMALGAVVGWGLLSPLAKAKGWAPGPVDDWEHGSKGWIVWVSLAIMLSDAIVSLGYIALRPLVGPRLLYLLEELCRRIRLEGAKSLFRSRVHEYTAIPNQIMAGDQDTPSQSRAVEGRGEQQKSDAPPEQRIGGQIVSGGLAVSILLCILTTHFVFGDLVPLHATTIAIVMALLLSIMGVRALGETDLNPVSGISKLAQLIFVVVVPQSNKSSVIINLVAGAIVSPASNIPQSLSLRFSTRIPPPLTRTSG